MPAHITVLYPFIPNAATNADVTGTLTDLFASQAQFGYSLTQVRLFPDTAVYLAPEPAAPFIDLTRAVVGCYADYPPYRGIHDSIVPHLTVAQATRVALQAIADTFAARVVTELPIAASADAVALFEKADGRWRHCRAFALGAGASHV